MVWSFTCCRPESSERLIEFAQALSNVDQNHATFQAYYPMYTLPVDSILHMVYPTAHEQLLADNSLVIFDQSLGQAMFISHEWSGRSHPDPYGEQVRVLQDALHHMLYVADTVPVEFASELIFGQDRGMMTSELKSRELFVWFDFFSCPQLEGSVQGIEDVQQQNAIRSIPAYVEMSRFFVIHCPFVRRDGSDHLLNKHTWARRAWCRLERLASQLHAGLGSDRSLGAIFPDWYAGNTERWLAASSKQLQVLCTETTGFEVPKRISVNLSAYRKAQHVVIFLGDKETWGSPDSPKSAQGEMDMAPRNSLPTGEFKRPRGKLRFSRSLSQQQIPDPIVTPLDFVTEQRYVCTAQVQRDVDRHLNLVIFGAAGDLAKKKTFPSIFQLHLNRVLPSNISVVACDDPGYHSNISNAETLLQNRLKPYLEKECSKPSDLREFAENLQFVPVDFKDAGTVRKLDEHLRSNAKKLQDNRIFYLALPPFLFETAVKFIREECWPENGYTRVIVEKPFGHDLQSAKALGSQVAQYLQESQVYRIDHYLAKNMVLNILALRFANRELGRLFHADNVSIVRITFKEDINVAGRAGYFDGYGIIRDVMQNHLLQLLTLVLMEAPASLDPEDVRDEKVKVLKQFRPVTREDCVVGQYDGYQDDPAIQAINEKQGYKSKCPTFAACVLHLDNERWSNVPIIMKAGKSLERRSTIVRLQFKKAPPNSLFGDQPQNELVIRIQPDEAIYYRILAKTPGLSARAHEVQRTILDLDLRKEEVGRLPDAYEKLIHDVIQGESHNFVRADEVEEGWRIFDPLLQSLESPSAPHPFPYAQGTRGPPEADALINSTGYRRYTATGVQGLAQDFH